MISRVLNECLSIKPGESVLIISDNKGPASLLSTVYAKELEKKECKVNSVNYRFAGDALKALARESVVICIIPNKLGDLGCIGKSFRRFCKEKGHRFVSTTGLNDIACYNSILDSMDVDYRKLHRMGLWLKGMLDSASRVRIKTNIGTDIIFDVKGVKAVINTGNYSEPGTGGNIPAGEVYIAPNTCSGKVLIDGSIRTNEMGILVDEPVELTVVKGMAAKISGKYASLLKSTLSQAREKAKYPSRVNIIGELGIGINPKALVVGTTIIDEKVLGTAHIALGSNYWFGGKNKTVFHADQVFREPKIFIDGREIDINGQANLIYNEAGDTDKKGP